MPTRTMNASLNILISIMYGVKPIRFGYPPAPEETENLLRFLTGREVTGPLDKAVEEIASKLRDHLPEIARGTIPPYGPPDTMVICSSGLLAVNKDTEPRSG